MLEKRSTNATAAKIRAMYSNMFTIDNYRELMAKKTVAEAAQYLAASPRFKEVMRETDPNTVHRGYLEELISRANFAAYLRIIKFQGLDKDPFYNYEIRDGEVMLIISSINRINSSLEGNALADVPGYLIKYIDQRLMNCAAAETYSELLGALKGTRYYRVLSKVPLREDGKADLKACEVRLRNDYYEEILSQAKDEDLKALILKDIDCRNIINAYRMKAYFDYTPEQIKSSSLRFTAVGSRTMNRIYEARDARQMLDIISRTVYGKNSPDTDVIEMKLNSVKIRSLRRVLTSSTSAAAAVFAFVQLCRIDAANIIRIIEGIRYGAEPALIESQLVTL